MRFGGERGSSQVDIFGRGVYDEGGACIDDASVGAVIHRLRCYVGVVCRTN